MEKKKNGGARPGAGRKPKAEEARIAELMDSIMSPEEVFEALSKRIKVGDTNATKTWLNYRYGMPKQQVEQTNVNIDAGQLTDEEIKKINDGLERSY